MKVVQFNRRGRVLLCGWWLWYTYTCIGAYKSISGYVYMYVYYTHVHIYIYTYTCKDTDFPFVQVWTSRLVYALVVSDFRFLVVKLVGLGTAFNTVWIQMSNFIKKDRDFCSWSLRSILQLGFQLWGLSLLPLKQRWGNFQQIAAPECDEKTTPLKRDRSTWYSLIPTRACFKLQESFQGWAQIC